MRKFNLRERQFHTREKSLNGINYTLDLILCRLNRCSDCRLYSIPYRCSSRFNSIENTCYGTFYGIKHCRYCCLYRIDWSSYRRLYCIPYCRCSIPDGVEYCSDNCFNGIDHCCYHGFYCIPNSSKYSLDGIHHCTDNSRNCIDNCCDFGFNCIPNCNNNFLAVLPNKSERQCDDIKCRLKECRYKHNRSLNCILDTLPQIREECCDASPQIYEKILNSSPYFIPRSTEPSKHHIGHILNHIHVIGKGILDKIPYRTEDAFDTFPCLRPVACKDSNEYI